MAQKRTRVAEYIYLQIFFFYLCLVNVSAGTSAAVDTTGCYITSRTYNGTASTTDNGRTCQAWASQSPQRHMLNKAANFPMDDSVEAASNYCRDPDSEGYPWCYTTDRDHRWESCGLPLCAGLVTIDTRSVTFIVSSGDSALLECHVTDLKDSQQVKWEFVDHNVTISLGNKIIAESGKYEIAAPAQDQSGQTNWNLHVNNIQLADQGTYQCSIVGAIRPASVVHHISIDNAPTMQTPTENFNVTECCLDTGVTSCALPLCNPQGRSILELMPIFNDADCMYSNLVKILQCAHGERNHVGCCLRKGIADICLPVCDGTLTEAMMREQRFDTCASLGVISVIGCFAEGQFNLPTRPVSVTGVSMGDGFMLSWQPPEENPDSVTGYKIQYRTKSTDLVEFTTSRLLDGKMTHYHKTGLTVGVVYEARVTAISDFGASQPSYTVDIYTYEPVDPAALNETIKACCVEKEVSAVCQPYCNADPTQSVLHPDTVLTCYTELSKMFSCLIGMKNHTPCCERVAIPPPCYPLCSGQVPLHDWGIAQCIPVLPLIMACAMEGSNLLPSPPQNTHLMAGSLTSSSLILQWDPPSDNSALSYVVAWKQVSASGAYNTETETRTSHKITGLEELTQYEVFVASQNDNGTSLPEMSIVVITEAESSDWEPLPYNETNCCVVKGVPADCLKICDLTFRQSADFLVQAIICPFHLEAMFKCASDGRDHTYCCEKSGMTEDCLPLCKITPYGYLGPEHLPCVSNADILNTCFEEGRQILPKSPKSVFVKDKDVNSITIDWSMPDGPNITSYVVDYSLDDVNFQQRTTVETFMVVDKLLPGKLYYILVYSVNEHGKSLPSNTLVTSTLPVPLPDSGGQAINWDQVWTNRTDCCSNSQLSSSCEEICMTGVDVTNPDCLVDLDKIIKCATDGRNHYDCCKGTPGFPVACLPYCQAKTLPRELTSAMCFTHIGSMFTCFTEGKGLLPTPPQNFMATNVTYANITVKWSEPASNCDQDAACQYKVRLWNSYRSTELITTVTDLQYTFTGLTHTTTYTVSAIAFNSRGMSLATPTIIVVTTLHPNYKIQVTQNPSGVLDKGSQTSLECATIGSQTVAIFSWVHNKQTLATDSSYLLKNLDEHSTGKYTCVVRYYDDVTTSKSLIVNVRYLPVAVSLTVGNDNIVPGVGMDAMLTCEYEGFPSIISWKKDDEALPGDKYFLHPLVTHLDSSITVAKLQIHSVVEEDYGTYACMGENKFGKDVNGISETLREVMPTLPPLPSVSPGLDPAGCCRARNLPESCIVDICTIDIDITSIIYDSSLSHCSVHLPEYVACAADSRDHSKCCRQHGVSEYCLPFCAGSTPVYNSTWELAMCLSHQDMIFNCLEDGFKKIPSPPLAVIVRMDANDIKVRWSPPEKNPHMVKNYKIYYRNNDTEEVHHATLSFSTVSFVIQNVQKGVTYVIWVVALNQHGKSNSSKEVIHTVTAITPSKPLHLRYLVDGVTIRLTWDRPMSTVPVTLYNIYYRTTNPIGGFFVENTTGLSYLLQDLQPLTEYRISVRPLSADGPGSQSDKINVTTGADPTETSTLPPCNWIITVPRSTATPQIRDTGSDQKAVGLAVGLVLAIVFLVAIGIFAILMFRRMQNKRPTTSQTVALENPQYADSSKVSGLPGDTDTENAYNYVTLHEDRDDPTYSDLHRVGIFPG